MAVKKRYTVLTYNFGGCEPIREVKRKASDAEYILVTDDIRAESKTWTIVLAHLDDSLNVWEKCYDVRFHPFDYASTDIVVRLDASIQVNKSLKPLVDEFENGQYDRCLMIHPSRNLMKEEYDTWVADRGYPEEQAADMLHIMRCMGYDLRQRGLFQHCFEIVRKNRVNGLMNDMTYDLLRYASADGRIQRVSQTWFSMVVNKFFDDKLKIMPVSQDIITDGNLMQWYLHGTDTPIKNEVRIEPILFGKPVTCFEMNSK